MINNNNDKTFSSAAAAAAGVENADSSALVARGRRFPWGDCPPKGAFLGANVADFNFKNVFDEEYVRSKRNEKFNIDWNYNDGYSATSPVGTFPKSPAVHQYGLFDIAGNVREWTQDVFDPDAYNYRAFSAIKNPLVMEKNLCTRPDCKRVVRGGSWADGCCHQRIETSAGRDIRTETRSAEFENIANDRTGFRLACYLNPNNNNIINIVVGIAI